VAERSILLGPTLVDEIEELVAARRKLQRQLAHVLRRVGPDHPNRATVNADRALKRKRYRRALRANAEATAALLDSLPNFTS
jgi:hypothetical protein